MAANVGAKWEVINANISKTIRELGEIYDEQIETNGVINIGIENFPKIEIVCVKSASRVKNGNISKT